MLCWRTPPVACAFLATFELTSCLRVRVGTLSETSFCFVFLWKLPCFVRSLYLLHISLVRRSSLLIAVMCVM
jgi:hypothetical protein